MAASQSPPNIFQFTTSRGGRRVWFFTSTLMIVLSIHDLPRRSTNIKQIFRQLFHLSIHDLPRRSTPLTGLGCRPSSFNSRPPEEVDYVARTFIYCETLSIHDLPRRSTVVSVIVQRIVHLSIHDLPRRSTAYYQASF